jgi:hypothetical protein
MTQRLFGNLVAVLLLLCLAVPFAWAQAGGASGSVAVTVVDPTGSVVVHAALELRDLATNTVRRALTQEVGNYRFVNLPLGAYSLSVSKPGFETQVFNNVTVQAAQTTDLKATLRVGAATQTVEVTAEATPLVTATINTIGTTVTTSQVEGLPLQGRNVTQLTTLMAGYTGTWNGLPTAAQGNNVDGVVSSTSRMKFGGNATPVVGVRLENIQEMTVQTDALDMNQGFGNSAMQINMATRRGGNSFHGMLFEDHRNAALNANSWINNARGIRRPALILNDFGGNLGGPILRDKLFFFGSLAIQKLPSGNNANANVLTPAAQSGLFRYAANPNGVNVLSLAAANGFPNTVTSTTASGLSRINAVQGEGIVTSTSDPNINNLGFIYSGATTYYYPNIRVDYNATQNLRMNFSFNEEKFEQLNGDSPNFPGNEFSDLTSADNLRTSYTLGLGLDWTISPTVINQLRGGFLYYFAGFSQGYDESRRLSLPHVGWGYGSSPYGYPGPNSRYFPNFNAQDTVSWQKGAHALSFGGSYWREQDHYTDPPFAWPNYNLGIDANDPANAMFTAANFPGASAVELNRARGLYATLVGRVSGVNGRTCYDPKRGAYSNVGELCRAVLNEVQSQWGLFFQDSWRMRPSFTLNYGLRWDFIKPNVDLREQYHSATPESVFGPSGVGNLFNPGSLPGTMNPMLETRPRPYEGWNVTPQPSIGFAWNPRAGDGFLGKLLGGDGTVIRSSYSLRRWVTPQQFFWNSAANYGAFYYQNWNSDPGINFTPGSLMLGNNPTLGGDPLPPLTFAPPVYQPSAPLSEFTFRSGRLSGFAADIKQPYTQSWNFGIQRQLGRTRVLELRYNGNRTVHQWLALNTNQVNVFAARPGEASFLDQFKQAQQNLAINGGTSFANRGLPGQGALPVFEAAFGNAPASSGFANSTFIQSLRQGEAARMALALAGAGSANARYFCNLVGAGFGPCATNLGYTGAGAGYPINYFQANPFKTGETAPVSYLDSVGYLTYHGAQVELRQQMWHGLQFNANYTFSKNLGTEPGTNWEGQFAQFDLRNLRSSYMPTGFDRRHVFHFSPVYELPFGQGRQLLANSGGVVDKIVGGWTVSSIVTIQTGTPFRLTSGFWSLAQGGDSGVVLNGITAKDLQDSVGVYRVTPGSYSGVGDFVRILDPKYINGVRGEGGANSQFILPSTAPGVQGAIVNLYGPHQTFVDMAVSKNIAITERVRFKMQANFLNAFNHPVFGNSAGGTMNVVGSGFGVVTGTIGPNTVGTQTVAGGTSARQVQVRAQIQF